ncbi:MAG: hypothetical protein IJA84_07910, partial [Clostridia bacterium]|nr:hypothetical protein [Clostridia bacterium]
YDETEFEIACSQADFDLAAFEKFIAFLNSIVPINMPLPYRKDTACFPTKNPCSAPLPVV